MLLFLKLIALKLVAGISIYFDKNTCDRSSRSYKTVLALQIRLTDMTHNSLCLILIASWDKGAVVQTSTVFGTP